MSPAQSLSLPATARSDHPSLDGHSVTAALLVIVPVAFTIVFTLLGQRFEYPDILRQPTTQVLEKFAAGGSSLVALWYGMLAAALMFTAIPALVRRMFPEKSVLLDLSVTFGVLAGLVQALGFARWVFLVPALAAAQTDPSTSEATRAAVGVVFDAFNRYAGMGIGEHFGYLFTALWTLAVSVPLLRRSRLLGVSGAMFALGILAGLLEPLGLGWAGAVNAVAYLAWSAWMMVFGVVALRARRTDSTIH
jgi:hypothetical protein